MFSSQKGKKEHKKESGRKQTTLANHQQKKKLYQFTSCFQAKGHLLTFLLKI
jgi:hypothetical protein